MFIRPIHVNKNGKRHAYWALVESYRTEQGPRQRTVAYLGQLDRQGRLGIRQAAQGSTDYQRELFEDVQPEWVEIDAKRIQVENCRQFGGCWLALKLLEKLGIASLFKTVMPQGKEEIHWAVMAQVLIICRFCNPSSELYIAEHLYGRTALSDLLGLRCDKLNDDRLYRALDALLPHKDALEVHLKERVGELFDLKYDLLLYDVTSTYFEGQARANPLAQRGYSRDKRGDCKQVCIGLVVSRCGMPLGYEIFAGNRRDVTTVEEIVETMEKRYGKADRIWVMDRGMISEANMKFLREGNRRYIIGTPKSMLKPYEQELVKEDWQTVHKGLEVKCCSSPDGHESYILCRSEDRAQKEKAILERFESRIEEGLSKIESSCLKRKYKLVTVAKRVGRLLGQNTRAAGLFKTDIFQDQDGRTRLRWEKIESWRDWAGLSEGCYLLRSNVNDWTGEELWQAYMQLTEAEAAFRIHKSDLRIRPIWHQKQGRVEAHILVCFLAYVLWKTLGQLCRRGGLGNEPRRVLDELKRIQVVDVILPTRKGITLRRRCVTKPTDHQAILLQHLGLMLPSHLPIMEKKMKEM
ncbi:MAG: IS1634 family transposase [Planctomycetota bacterium]|jgi:transposase